MILDVKNVKFDVRKKYPTDLIVIREIWKENVYEASPERFNKGGVVVDLGANIGAFAIYAASIGATVYAVEPEPHNINALKRNIEINNMEEKIFILPYAISDKKGTAIINDDGGGSTIKDNKPGTMVELMPLDNMFSLYNIDEVDVMKIDIEGSEVEAILGASRDTIDNCKYITMEFDIRTGKKMGDIVAKLSETHHVRTMGSWERGGMIFAWRY